MQHQARQPRRAPLDGPGPRGLPDCYYTSRTLNSTFRYARFVKKLRRDEEEQRKGEENNLRALKDKQSSNFFLHCDRRSLINNVARRVDICMRSYQEDLDVKRKRLINLYSQEEEMNIRKFVEQAQQGAETLWQEKIDRLQYLQEKRRKEHQDKYGDTPISKCVHATPCIVKCRTKEAQQIQLYQMKEKQARKMAERELDQMWHEVLMKESEALGARMEKDAIDRYRRDMECLAHSDFILEQRRQQHERDRQRLKAEQLAMKMKYDEDGRKEMEAEEREKQKRLETAKDRAETLEERRRKVEKLKAEENMIQETWASLAGQGIADEQAKVDLMRRKEIQTVECNREMVALKENLNRCDAADDVLRKQEYRRQEDIVGRQRCQYMLWSQKQNKDVRKAMIDQIHERKDARVETERRLAEEDKYHKQLFEQTSQLIDHRAAMDLQARKDYQRQLLDQIQYNKLLKDKARQEELDQMRKGELAKQEYDQEIKNMLARPSYSEKVHPFVREMGKGLKVPDKCPCSRLDYCAEGKHK